MLPELTQLASLRVFMTTDAVTGTWQYALDLAQGLRAYDTDTTLCVLGPRPSATQQAAARRIPGLRLICVDGDLDWTARSPQDVLATAEKVASVARSENSRVIHLNSPALAAGPAFPAPVVTTCHSSLATWWHVVRGQPLSNHESWRKDLTNRGLLRADVVIAPSRAFARTMSEVFELARPPVVVHKGRRPSMRQTLPEGTEVPTKTFAFTAGRLWDEAKNLRVLDKAAARISIPVYATGQLAEPETEGIAFTHIRSLGYLTDGLLAEWLAAKPIFVSTSCYEPFGLPVLEAAEAGCPLILSDIPTHRELWEGAAHFVPCNDDVAVAAAIDAVATDLKLRTQLASAARRRARRYTAEVMAAKVRAIYGGLLRSAPARTRSGHEAHA